mmetsp:Transcript_14990/g.13159  ORF Transcript_14990/g.13159 Transcript_14990/m.13159 type:complete len:137 (-) Transcript_14990:147-557(-)
MITMLIFSPALEKHHGSGNYITINILLYIGQHLVGMLIMFIMTLLPPALKGGPEYYVHCSLGYSGVLYSYMLLWSHLGDKHMNIFGFCKLRKMFFPWIWIIINSFMVPEASFVGHLSGILFAVVLRMTIFTTDEKI